MDITTISGAQANATATQNQSKALSQDFDDFLQLLTTQLKYQDPLSPLDTNEFTNQLVQFSQVEQQINTNKKIDSLVNLSLSSSISAALGYVGLDANYISNDMHFDGTNPVNVTYSLATPATTAKLSVLDAAGKTIFSQDISGETGQKEFVWNGKDNNGQKMAEGTYTVQIDALDSKDKPVTSTVVVQGRVRGIESQDGQIFLLVGDRAVALANVLNAAEPKPVSQTQTPST